MYKSVLLVLVLSTALHSCSGGSEEGPVNNQPEPYIQGVTTQFEGNKVVAGYPVTLTGINFSPVVAENKVLYGVGLDAVALRVSEATEDHVVFTAPSVDKTQLKVRVAVNGVESNAVALEYTTLPVDPPEEPWSDEPTINLDGAVTVEIVPGVEWTTFHGKWEGQIRNINIVRTKLDEHNRIGIYFNYSHNGLDDLDEKCVYLDAVAGTNGPMACCQFVRVEGEVRHGATDANYWICNCAFTIDGTVADIVQVKDNYKAARLTNDPDGNVNPPANTLTVGCAGPLLVWQGKIQSYPEETSEDFLKTTHPRTAIGLSRDGKTVTQVAVDGRWYKSGWPAEQTAIGMSTPLLSKLMLGLGCYKAMNFDGGGGTAMWVYGQGNSRNIVNHVCENRWDWDGTTLRATGNAVYIHSDLK